MEKVIGGHAWVFRFSAGSRLCRTPATPSGKVYACNKNESAVLDTWDSFDECFCSIFDTLAACPTECEF